MTDDQFLVLVELLTEIRDALVPPSVEPDGECQHPEDQRVSFATPQRPDHWICNVCRFEHHGVSRI